MRIVRAEGSSRIEGTDHFAEVAVDYTNFGDEASTLRRMVNKAGGDLSLKQKTLDILREAGAASRAELDQALAIGEWVQKNIYYVHETRETFQRPETTLKLMAGDCDDFAVLICGMLSTIGIKEKLCILKTGKGPGPEPPMHYSHIFPVALVNQDGKMHRITLDATLDINKYPIRSLTNPIALVKARGDRVEPLFV